MTTSEFAVSAIASTHPSGALSTQRGFSYWHCRLQAAADFVTVASGLLAAQLAQERLVAADRWHGLLGVLVMAFIVVVLFAQLGIYSAQASPINIAETEKMVRGASVAIAIGTGASLYAHAQRVPLAWLSGFAVMVLLVLQRDVGHVISYWVKRRGYGVQRVLVYGSQTYTRFARLIWNNPCLGKTCVGFIHDRSSAAPDYAREERGSLGPWSDLERIARERRATDVLVAAPSVSPDKLADLMRDCERLNLHLSMTLDMPEIWERSLHYELLGDIPIARYDTTVERYSRSWLKRVVDVAGSAVLLGLLSPVFALTALLVKIESQGPVFFRHERVGKNGARFYLWKFRSMLVHSAPYERSPVGDSDTRLTDVGRILRRLSLDELPQLFNVLQGDMSLVGPRPEMPFIVQQYGPLEQRRLKVKPGLTGLWQISPARARPIHENMEFDLFYIAHQNLFLDCAILLRTVTAVVRGIGAA
jgi:exopolysaccharide biosynthesis polyprenyl glycosylphosphotransferase